MDHDVASVFNYLTSREKAVLVAFLQLSPAESGEIKAQSRPPRRIDQDRPHGGLSPESN